MDPAPLPNMSLPGGTTTLALAIRPSDMSYPGEFTFIIRDAETPLQPQSFKRDSAIFSHVARNRHSLKQKRRRETLDHISRIEKIAPDPKVAIPRGGIVSLKTRDRSRKSKTKVIPDARPFEGTACTVHILPSVQCEQCVRHGVSDRRSTMPVPSVPLLKGNSDPFSASALSITPEYHEELQLSSEFHNFWNWSVSTSSILREKALKSWLRSVRGAVHGIAEMHLLLAMGSANKTKFLSAAENETARLQSSAQSTMHKSRAITQLRQTPMRDNAPAFLAMLQLVSLEFYNGSYKDALMYHRAARILIAKHAETHNHVLAPQQQTVHALAEVWAAVSVLRRPVACGVVDFGGNRVNVTGVLPLPPSTKGFFLYEREWPLLHPSIASRTLRRVFADIRKVIMYLERLARLGEDDLEAFEIVVYLEAFSTAIRAELLNMWADVDIESAEPVHGGRDDSTLNLVFSATCLAALLSINIMFMYKIVKEKPTASDKPNDHTPPSAKPVMSSSVNHQLLRKLQKVLRSLYYQNFEIQLGQREGELVDFDLMIWLSYMTALGETLEAEDSTSRVHDVEQHEAAEVGALRNDSGMHYFKSYCTVLGLSDWKEMRGMLEKFCYFGGLMDGYLIKLIDEVTPGVTARS